MFEVSSNKVPVRYRPNAASSGWSYGRDLASLPWKGKHPLWNGHIILLNIHKGILSAGIGMLFVLWPRVLTFVSLARHPANCSTALPEVFSRDLQVCPCIRTILNLPGVHVGCINYGLLWLHVKFFRLSNLGRQACVGVGKKIPVIYTSVISSSTSTNFVRHMLIVSWAPC